MSAELEVLKTAAKLKTNGDYVGAENLLLELIEQYPDFAPAYNSLGSIYFAQDLWQKAEKAYHSAIECQADYVDAYYNLGLTLTRLQSNRDALTVYHALIELSPQHLGALFQLGCLLMKQHQFEQATRYFLTLLQIHPAHAETVINLGACYLKLNQLPQAEKYYLRALDIEPSDVQVLFNLGVIHIQQGLTDQAINYYLRAIAVDPDCYEAHNNLAVAFIALNERLRALQHFRETLRLQPGNIALQHTVAVLSGTSTATISPPEYISALFDSYASHYDPHVAKGLHYTVPQLLVQLIQNLKKPNHWDILDLGCGTGLCGELMKPWAKSLVGVDLSGGMLEIARQKRIYDALIQEEALSFLSKETCVFNLILAGDVLVYVGDLSAIFSAAYQALQAGGLFVFNVEMTERAPYYLLPSGRFAHRKANLDSLIKQTGFHILGYQTATLRQQENESVPGHIYLLEKP